MNIRGSFLRLDTDVSDNSSGFLSNSPLVGMQERCCVSASSATGMSEAQGPWPVARGSVSVLGSPIQYPSGFEARQ